jgi:hypothetical protein
MSERATSINQLPINKESEDSNIVQDIINQMDSDNIQLSNEQQQENDIYQNQQFNKQPIPIPQDQEQQQYYEDEYEPQYIEEPVSIQNILKEPLLVAIIVFIMLNPKVFDLVSNALSKYKVFENQYLIYALLALVSGVVFFGVKKYVI